MKRFLKKNILLILSLALVAALVGGTYAYLAATDNPVINLFKLAQIDTHITEENGPDGKKEVTIGNKDVSSVYVRARVLVSAGEVGATDVYYEPQSSATKPAGNAITISYNNTNWWYDGSDWFYYLDVLPGTDADGTMHQTAPVIYQVLVGSDVDTTKSFEVEVYQESVLTSAESFVLSDAQAAFAK